MTGPVQMTTTIAIRGEKRPATRAYDWHYNAATFPAGRHKTWELPGDLADVYMRDNGMFGGDLDLYKPEKRAAWEASAFRRHLAEAHGYDDSRPYVRRGNGGSMRLLITMTPEQAADWWPAASGLGWGDIRSAGLQPSPGAAHPSGETYECVPGPDQVRYPADGTVLPTNVIRFCEGCKTALIEDGAHGKDDRPTSRGDVELPGDDGLCSTAYAWFHGDVARFRESTSPRGNTANRAVNYLKALDAEGHKVGGWIDKVIAELPFTEYEDFEAMWATALVPAGTIKIPRDCCTPAPLGGVSMNGQAPAGQPFTPFTASQVPGGEDDEDAGPGAVTRLDQLRAGLMDWEELSKVALPEPVVQGWLFRNTLAWIKGEPGGGKTLAAIDMAGCVSTGKSWHGHRVEKGPVLYLVLEGAQSIRQRAEAWAALNKATPEGKTFSPVRVNLMDQGDAYAVAQLAHEMQPVLIVVDTQARATPGAEENSSRDMGTFVYHLEGIREACEACVLVVHHEPRSGQNLRGSTALEGAASTIIDATRDGLTVTLRTDASHGGRQKDAPENKPFALTMVPAGPGMALDLTTEPEALGQISQHALTILAQLAKAAGVLTTKALAELTEIPRTSLQRELYDLRDKGRVVQGQHGITHTWRLPEPRGSSEETQKILPSNKLGRSAQKDPGSPGMPKPAQQENAEKLQVSEAPAQPAQPAQDQPKPARPSPHPFRGGQGSGHHRETRSDTPAGRPDPAPVSPVRVALLHRLQCTVPDCPDPAHLDG